MTETKPLKNERVEVTFTLPENIDAAGLSVVGDFNNWNPSTLPMQRDKDGSWTARAVLDANSQYQFRYLASDSSWYTDVECARCPNPYGGENNVLET
jgi:1,4-alpha-glucan branching enzyme